MQMTSAPCEPPLREMLEADGLDVIACPDGYAVLENVIHRRPDAVLYALRPDCREDVVVLGLMRRAVPEVPLVLIAADDSLETRKVTQPLRPIYYAVCPVDGAELREAVRTAISRRGRGAGSGGSSHGPMRGS